MIEFLYTLFYFAIAVTVLVGVHEFGHFCVARLCGVSVLRFSIGIGKTLFSFKGKHGTEYVLALFPLGGYVKMLDESEAPVPDALLSQAFNRKPLLQRTAIVIAGPLFNFIFAVLALWGMFSLGITSVAPIVGSVTPGSPAETKLQPMDEIVAINGTRIQSWQKVQLELLSKMGSAAPLELTVRNLTTKEPRHVILSHIVWQQKGSQPDLLGSIGITPYMPEVPTKIGQVVPNYPASRAGIQKGDTIVTIDSIPVHNWLEVISKIEAKPEQTITLGLKRKGQPLSVTLKTAKKTEKGKTYGVIGAISTPITWPKTFLRQERYPFFQAFRPAVSETKRMIALTFQLMGKLVVGSLSLQSISGPVGIAQGAKGAAALGLASYLSFLSLVSISLGVLNILPIPLLDGGYLLYYLIEAILRRPVSERTKAMGMRIGIAIVLALVTLAVFNDFVRLLS